MTPSGAKTFGVELPCAGARVAGLLERFTGHLSTRRKGHFEFSARRRCGHEGLAHEEVCLNLARRHGLGGQSGACYEERHSKSKPTKAQHGKVPFLSRSKIDPGYIALDLLQAF